MTTRVPPHRLGAVNVALRALQSALGKWTAGRVRLIKYDFMAQPVPPRPDAPRRAGGLRVDEIRSGDARVALFPRPSEEIARRFANGARCFAVWHGDAFAGFLWFVDGSYDEDEARCRFRLDPSDRAVWDFDVAVEPRFRNGRAFALLWASAFDALRARGAAWSISRVSSFNVDSIRAHRRLGAQRTGWALFLLLGSLHVSLTSTGRVTCRRLQQGPYPTIDVKAPAGPDAGSPDQRSRPSHVP